MKKSLYLLLSCCFAICFSTRSVAQQLYITTIAGNGTAGYTGDGGAAATAEMDFTFFGVIATDASGNIYITDAGNNVVRKVSPAGIISTFAGGGSSTADGVQATAASFNAPSGLAIDAAGNVYISDFENNKVRKVNTSGIITTVAGNGTLGYGGDGLPATSSSVELNGPYGLAFDASGNLYICDAENNRVRKINAATGIISTFAGSGVTGFAGDGSPATSSSVKLNYPGALSFDATGNLYISDFSNNCIRKVNTSGIISTFAGTGGSAGSSGDGGQATAAKLNSPDGTVWDASGNFYIADGNNYKVRKVNSSGVISTIVGTGVSGYNGDGIAATAAQLYGPDDVKFDINGHLLITDGNNRVRELLINHTPAFTGGSVQSLTACENTMTSINSLLAITDSDVGETETWSQAVAPAHGSLVSSYTTISTGSTLTPTGLSYTPAAGYVGTDSFSMQVFDGMAYDTTKVIVTVNSFTAGEIFGPSIVYSCNTATLTTTGSGGTWSSANPGVATVSSGGVVSAVSTGYATISYYVTNGCGTIAARKQISVGVPTLTTIAGGVIPGYTGDGGAATAAKLHQPHGLAIDAAGNIYFADDGNNVVRKISTSGIITTVAGTTTGGAGADGIAATTSMLDQPFDVALDASGNIYIGDAGSQRVRMVNASTGIITTVAGRSGLAGFTGDNGAATAAELHSPAGVAFDAAGNLYIGDAANNRVRQVNTSGTITTVAGGGASTAEGVAATTTSMSNPNYVHIDPSGNLIIADNGHQKIRSVNSIGIINTIIGNGTAGYLGDGNLATASEIQFPGGVAYDGAGNIYLADYSNNVVRIVNPFSDTINTFAGTGTQGYEGDGHMPADAEFYNAVDVAFDPNGNMIIADYNNNVIRKIAPVAASVGPISGPSSVCVGATITLANGANGGSWSSPNPSIATVNSSTGVVTGTGVGNVLISYTVTNGCGTSVATAFITVGAPIITTLAGTGIAGTLVSGSPAASAQMNGPSGVAFDAAGNMYYDDYYNNQVQKMDLTGHITTVAGNGTAGYAGDGTPATSAAVELNAPSGIGIDGAGNIYFAEYLNHVIRKINTSGIISTVIGSGIAGFSPDGTAASVASINHPASVYVDAAGNVYFPDDGNQRVRKMTAATGLLSTIAGTGTSGYNLDNVAGTLAEVGNPFGITVDVAGNVYFADQTNNRIRMVNTAGIISTIAGTGSLGYTGDGGPALHADLNTPTGVLLDPAGNLYIADRDNNCVRFVNMATGIISTFAGRPPNAGYAGDGGPATAANLNNVPCVNMDAAGNIYISDFAGDRIRKVAPINPTIGPVSGSSPLCQGASTSFTDPGGTPGLGVWSTSNAGIAYVNPTSGLVTGTGGGLGTITYTVSSACGTLMNTQTVNVNPLPNPGIISGASPIVYMCNTLSLSDPQTGGTWSSSAPTVATVNTSGLVSAVSVGNTTISYTFTNSCGTAAAKYQVSASTPIITTIAGTPGVYGYSGDGGPATAAKLNFPQFMAVDNSGNIYISDYDNNAVRKINTSGIITTIAGPGTSSVLGDGGPATAAYLSDPAGIAVDGAGNVYICDYGNKRIRKINSSGIISTVAGNGTSGYNGDGIAATAAELRYPDAIALDAAGNLYIGDNGNDRIRMVNTAGIISTFCGTGLGTYNGDGIQATTANISQCDNIHIDAGGNLIFSDEGLNRLRSIAPDGVITTIAGNGTTGYTGDGGPATAAEVSPYGIAVDGAGNIYFANGELTVRVINRATGIISTYAGTNTGGHTGDNGPPNLAELSGAFDLAFDPNGNLLILEGSLNMDVRKVAPIAASIGPIQGPGTVCPTSTITLTDAAGGGVWSNTNPGIATVGSSTGVVTGVSAGNTIVSYSVNNSCGSFTSVALVSVGTPIITTVAGNGSASYSGEGVVATASSISDPPHTAMDSHGNLYFGDYANDRIRMVTPAGIMTTIAGTGVAGAGADGISATTSAIKGIASLVFDAAGDLYFCDYLNSKIRMINTAGIVTTVAGTGGTGYTSDGGAAATTELNQPWGIVIDQSGNIVFADRYNNRIRKINTSTGIISTIAGTGTASFGGDGGPATAAYLNGPCDMAIDLAGNLYFGDFGNSVVRKINTTTGIISTVAGMGGMSGYAGDNGPAAAARLTTPVGVAVDSAYNIYIGDYGNNVIRKVNGNTGIITTIAGTGSIGSTGDGGPPTAAKFYQPQGIGIYNTGDIYIADAGNNRIRKITQTTPTVNAISATTTSMCLGSSISLSDVTAGGTWSSSNGSIASVGTSGTVTGAGVGTAIISYSVPFSCGNMSVVQSVTVNSITAITGTLNVCVGSTTQLNNTTSGGTWTTISSATASIGTTGLVTGVSADTTTVTYAVGGCYVNAVVTVQALPSAITPATASVCAGSVVALTDPESGGSWSSSNAHGVVVSGAVTGTTTGIDTISYSIGGCAATATVNVLNAPAAITPASAQVCTGLTIALTDPTTGGVWSSSNSSGSVVSGTVTGATAGIDTISYTLGTCAATSIITVNASPGAITPAGPVNLCIGATATVNSLPADGVWSSGAIGTATVGASSGVVTGMAAGSATISYTNAAGCSAVKTVTVNITPGAIIPASSIACIGNQTTLTDALGGGTWSATNGNASVVGGTVTGIALGADTIVYTIGSCTATATVTVNAPPGAISPAGPIDFCVGSGITLTDGSPGAWSSSDATKATVGASTGVVAGVGSGVVNISYTNAAGCSAIKAITVDVTPGPLSPSTAQLCTGTSATLTDAIGTGTWTSSAGGIATVTGGVVTGAGFGTATITYTIGACYTTAAVTVNLSPTAGTATGPSGLCISTPELYTDATGGGTWRSSNTTVATVTAGGLVTGIGIGADSIIYSVNNGCGTAIAAVLVTVNSSPGAGVITGLSTICAGTFTFLADTVTGGTWAVSNATGTITGTGLFSGIASGGTDTVSYTVTNGCGTATVKRTMNIGAYLTAGTITGPTTVCQGASAGLTDLAPGGTWGMSNTSADVVGGSVTGLGGGVDTVYYTVTSPSGCGIATASHVVTVNPLPVAAFISGPSIICAGMTVTYTDDSTGGLWNTTNATATITGWGFLTAVTPGTDTISYSITNACGTTTVTQPLTIGASITAGTIAGGGSICAGSTIALTDGATGGSWSSSNTSATVSGGSVTGVHAGVDTIAYTVSSSCGMVAATASVTINPLPAAGSISGPASLCLGTGMAYTDPAVGGAWSSSNTSAAVTAGGFVTPLSAGTDTISYSVTNGCGTAAATEVVAIVATPDAGTIGGAGGVCVGATLMLTDPVPGGTWSASNTDAIVVGGAVTGVLTGTDIISYTVTNSCGTAVATASVPVNPLPVAATITGVPDVCISSTTTLSDVAVGGSWSASNTNAVVSGGLVTGVSVGTDIISYSVSNSCGMASATVNVTVSISPDAGSILGAANVCIGSTITLTDPASGGAWSSSNTSASVVGGVVTGLSIGTDTINYVVTNACGTATASQTISVDLSASAGTITGALGVCKGATILLSVTGGEPGGVWSSSNATATVSGGVVTGVNAGTDTIKYTVTNSCGSATASKLIYITEPPSPGTIAGPADLCVGGAITLTDGTTGGTWSSSSTAIAAVAGGMVSGVAPGTATISYTVSNGCGPRSATHAVTVLSNADCNTLVNRVINSGEALNVFPNPNTGTFTLNLSSDYDEEVDVVITNITGEKVREFTMVTNKTIELNLNNATGIYFLSATTAHGNYVAKVVVD